MQFALYSFENIKNLNKNYPFYYIGTDVLKYDILSKKFKEFKFEYELNLISDKEKKKFSRLDRRKQKN